MADDLDRDCGDPLRWRSHSEMPWAFLSRLKTLIWPEGLHRHCANLSNPAVVQNLFLYCVHAEAVSLDQREIFFAEACCDNRLAVKRPGGILKENLWQNRRWGTREDLAEARKMIRCLDSGDYRREAAERDRQRLAANIVEASHRLQTSILETDDPWSHWRAWWRNLEARHEARKRQIMEAAEAKVAAKAAADKAEKERNAARAFLYLPRLQALKFEELDELLSDPQHVKLHTFLHQFGSRRLIELMQPEMLVILEAHLIAERSQTPNEKETDLV